MVKIEILEAGDDGSLQARLVGKIDEKFSGKEILDQARPGQPVRLRLDGVRSISSLGVRALEQFIHHLDGKRVVLVEISPALASQVAMIPNLLGSAEVRSARLPFVCPHCGTEQLHAIPYVANAGSNYAPNCPSCGTRMEFDGFSEVYLPLER